jgi:hypothetical protein
MTASTTVVSLATKRKARKVSGAGALGTMTYNLTIADTDLEQDDILEAGYVPGGVTVLGFVVTVTDMDTGVSPAMIFEVQLGTTALVAGLTTAQGGGSDLYPCVPTETTVPTVVRFKTTTAPATAAAGTATITAVYCSA